MRNAPHYIAIEGPLTVGKSRLAEALSESIRARKILERQDNPHLESFFMNRSGAAFLTQMHFLFERCQQLLAANIEQSRMPIVADYMIERDKLFAYLNLNDDEISVYNSYYQNFKKQLPVPDLVVYLKSTPEILSKRLTTSGKTVTGYTKAYIEGAVRAFDHFFEHYKAADVMIVDTTKADILNDPEALQSLLEDLVKPVYGTQFFLSLGS